jgi:cell division transport system ATP-binding protein
MRLSSSSPASGEAVRVEFSSHAGQAFARVGVLGCLAQAQFGLGLQPGGGLGGAGGGFAFGLFAQNAGHLLIKGAGFGFRPRRGGLIRFGLGSGFRLRLRFRGGFGRWGGFLFRCVFAFRRGRPDRPAFGGALEPCVAAVGALDVSTDLGDDAWVNLVLCTAIRTNQSHPALKIYSLSSRACAGCGFRVPAAPFFGVFSKERPTFQAFAPRPIETAGGVRQNCRGRQQAETGVIELKDVSYGYGGSDLLSGVSLSLRPGSFHFLTGPSGSGKTTFLRLCYLDLMATAGRVELFGQPARKMTRDDIAHARRRIGVVHQDCQFLDHLPVSQNVALPLEVAGRPENPADLEELLAWVGLAERADALPPELSGGERQRAALARAVIMSPDVVLADEPTGNVDWEMSLRLLSLLVELNRMGKAILVATHDLNLIRAAKKQVSARVLRIRDRQLQLAGADL